MDEVLGGVDGGFVHHLHAAGNDAGADDGGDAVARRLVRGEPDEEGARAFGLLQDAHGDLGDDAQKPFGAGHQPEKVVALAVQVLAAEADDLAVDEDHLQAQEVVRRQPVFQAVHAARIGAHVAADGTGDLARRIGRVVEAPVLDGVGNAQVGDARLGDDDAVLVIDVEDPVELAKPHGDGVGQRHGAPGERRAGAAGNDLDAFGEAERQDRRHLGRGLGQDHDQGYLAVGRQAVALVDAELFGVDDDTLAGDDPAQPGDDVRPPGDDPGIGFRHSHRGPSPCNGGPDAPSVGNMGAAIQSPKQNRAFSGAAARFVLEKRRRADQPWRALKRPLRLLIT